jgi:hypothetical protein
VPVVEVTGCARSGSARWRIALYSSR